MSRPKEPTEISTTHDIDGSARAGGEGARAVLAQVRDCIITINSEGRIVEFNPSAEQTFGYSRERALGQQMAELLIPTRFRAQHYRGLRQYLATGESSVAPYPSRIGTSNFS